MPERWERELRKLRHVDIDEHVLRERVERGPSPEGPRPRRERLLAGVVALAVFAGAGAFAWNAFTPGRRSRPLSSGEDASTGPILTISAHAAPGQASPPEALVRYGDVEAVVPVQGGEGWGMGNGFPAAMFGPHEAAIPVGTPVLIETDAEQLEVAFNHAYPDGDLVPQPIAPGEIGTLPSEPGELLIQLSATWPDGRAEFSVFVHLYQPVDVLDVDCRAHRVPVWQSRVVRAQPDGIHATFQADASRDVRVDAPGFTSGTVATLEPGSTSLELSIPPGVATVGCNNAPDSQITVVDPLALWVPSDLACPPGDELVSVAAEGEGDRLVDEEAVARRLLTLRDSDEIVPPGYPEAVRDQMLPSKVMVRRAGQVVAKLDVWLGLPSIVEGQACEIAGIHSKDPDAATSPPPTGEGESEIVVRIEGLGRSERSRDLPVMTMSFGSETARGCTEGFEWTTADGRKLDEASGRKDSILVPCSYDPLFVVPPRTPIVVLAESGTEVFVTRTTTPMYTGIDGVGVSVTWPDGNADFLAYFEVRYGEPVPRNIVLDCPPSDRIPFAAPDGPRILPGGSAYITGNLPGFIRGDVVEQMTRDADAGPGGWEGVWQVTRAGSVIATVEFGELSGLACRGSGVAGA